MQFISLIFQCDKPNYGLKSNFPYVIKKKMYNLLLQSRFTCDSLWESRRENSRLLINERHAQENSTTNHNQPQWQDFYLILTGHLIATVPFAPSEEITTPMESAWDSKIYYAQKHEVQMKISIVASTEQSYTIKGK